jgi:hypothetical protein
MLASFFVYHFFNLQKIPITDTIRITFILRIIMIADYQKQPELIQLAQAKQSKTRRVWHVFVSLIYITIFVLMIAGIIYVERTWWTSLATAVSFLWAATVFALQNFIASFFTYLYISFTNQYDVGDIIKIGDPRMTGIGEVLELGLFSTIIKELDSELLFTGRQFILPNQIFFTAGVFNYTKNNLFFWHTITTLIATQPWVGCDDLLDRYRTIIHQTHQEIIAKHHQLYERDQTHHPKYKYSVTDRGIEIEVRLNIHFYNVLECNNLTACRLVDAHRNGTITLVEHKDYKGVYTKS